ncbi:ABC transporter ATP-binding protein [uncultured Tessaracoccus sp.]|uniref:ABC transporter ATP-binding protein n=1 Tax=uncultured Tessaracoccus sp. TaxID=905023 RepID=UPI00262F16FD|nr:ABC transporter ATP-binding protein [uncultured Tessaracoccus sp.]
MLDVRDVRIERGGKVVLDGVSLVARQGETVGILGPNGSGKSSLLLALQKALQMREGQVLLDGTDVQLLGRRAIAQAIAVVAQETGTTLPLSVRDSVMLGRLASSGILRYGASAEEGIVEEALERVGLAGYSERLITQLSGGERQRALIARAIAQQATHLLLDEPTNHLDLRHQFALLDLIASLDCATVIVLHDLNLAARCCDRLLLLDEGQLVAAGTPDEVLQPALIEQVYGVSVERIESGGKVHLIFGPPRSSTSA